MGAMGRFLAGGDSKDAQARHNNTFKLIPRVTKGSWIIKQSVGTTPCLLGNKLQTKYFQCVPPPRHPVSYLGFHCAAPCS